MITQLNVILFGLNTMRSGTSLTCKAFYNCSRVEMMQFGPIQKMIVTSIFIHLLTGFYTFHDP